jgi:hypothetical protein
VKRVSWIPFGDLLYIFCVDVAALIILDRSFSFVLMIGGVLEKAIVDLGGENFEKFGNNNASSNVPRVFVKV